MVQNEASNFRYGLCGHSMLNLEHLSIIQVKISCI